MSMEPLDGELLSIAERFARLKERIEAIEKGNGADVGVPVGASRGLPAAGPESSREPATPSVTGEPSANEGGEATGPEREQSTARGASVASAPSGEGRPKLFRNDSTPEGKRIWAAVEKAAANAPSWMRNKAGEGQPEGAEQEYVVWADPDDLADTREGQYATVHGVRQHEDERQYRVVPASPAAEQEERERLIRWQLLQFAAPCRSSKHDKPDHSALSCWRCHGSLVDPDQRKPLDRKPHWLAPYGDIGTHGDSVQMARCIDCGITGRAYDSDYWGARLCSPVQPLPVPTGAGWELLGQRGQLLARRAEFVRTQMPGASKAVHDAHARVAAALRSAPSGTRQREEVVKRVFQKIYDHLQGGGSCIGVLRNAEARVLAALRAVPSESQQEPSEP